METGYQRGKIQDESLHYEHMKHDGSLPIIGVNTFMNPKGNEEVTIELARSTEDEKMSQIKRLRDFNQRSSEQSNAALNRIRTAAINNENIFVELVDAVRFCSLGQISNALYEVGGAIPQEYVTDKGEQSLPFLWKITLTTTDNYLLFIYLYYSSKYLAR